MISNSIDTDFIHGDIHSRSCKKVIVIKENVIENGNFFFAAILPGP